MPKKKEKKYSCYIEYIYEHSNSGLLIRIRLVTIDTVVSLELPDTAVSPQNPDAQPMRTVSPFSPLVELALFRLLPNCE